MRIVLGILMVIAGFLLVWKTEPVVGFTGLSDWAEQHMGSEGGTRLMYKLIGIAIIFFGMMAITNLHQGFLEGTVGKLFAPRV